MNRSYKKLVYIALFASSCSSLNPIGQTTATVGAVAGGLIAGAAAGVGTYYVTRDKINNMPLRYALSSLAGVGAGGLTWYLLNQWLNSLTPQGRLATATALVQNVTYDSLISRDFATTEDFFSHINVRFGSSWPLILGREHLMHCLSNLETALSLANKARNEAISDPSSTELCKKCLQLSEKIPFLGQTIETKIAIIIQNEKYDLQVQLYEKHLEAERERAHQQMLQNQSLMHDSTERERDRLHEDDRDSRRIYNQRDILNRNADRPVNLNIG